MCHPYCSEAFCRTTERNAYATVQLLLPPYNIDVKRSESKGRPLHEYANLYICARNPMIYKRQNQHESLCVLRVSTDVLDLAGVIISDQNAASDYTRFAPGPRGLRIVDRDLVFAESWAHPHDQIAHWRHKSIKCAEVLVPDVVDPKYIDGAYVPGAKGKKALQAAAPALLITTNRHMFFQ